MPALIADLVTRPFLAIFTPQNQNKQVWVFSNLSFQETLTQPYFFFFQFKQL